MFAYSEDYPYYSTLDLIAKRCLARGTNAWTQTDATCYTVQTAGSSGFLNILPIYMDHILYPLLTKNNFITEVHHVKGDGEDAGVVYSEMQVSCCGTSKGTYYGIYVISSAHITTTAL